nr:hypothetical protein [Ferruginibacter sp.]
MKKAILKIVILFLFCFTIKANLFCQIGYTNVSNNCIVEAKIIPGNDSIIANNSPAVTFMSASTNANSFKFIIDNIVYPINSIATVSFGVGITEVKLVAQNGNCTDTARCFYFNYGNYTNDTNNILLDYGIAGNINQKSIDFIKSRDSGFIIAGDRDHTSFANYLPPAGLIIKTTPRNCIKWSKIYTPIDNSQNNVISIDESYEDDIYVGLSQFPNSSFLIKNDKLGTELWTRKFINISGNDSIKISKIKALENGNILVLGKNDATNYYLRALLLDKNGNLLWQKKLNKNNSFFQHFISIVEKDEHVYICSSVGHTENNIFFSYGIITKINSQTGATLWSKYYKVNNGGRIYLNKISLIDNFIALSTTIPSMSTSHYNLCSIIFIDEDGFVKKSKELLFERRTTTSYVDIYQIKDKKYFLYIKGTEVIPNIANWNHSTIALLDSNFNTISVKNLFGERVLNFDKAMKYNDNSIALITTGLGYGLISGLPSFSKKIIINKIDTSNYFTT